MSRTGTKPEPLRIISTEDGLHLKDSILWFDAIFSGSLSFISEASENLRALTPQIITTEETIKTLEVMRKKAKALVCQYNRPFSIGRLRMELLPSGHCLGGASLYVETDNNSLLYAPSVQSQKVTIHRTMQLKKAKILILGAHAPGPESPAKNRNREKESLLQKLKEYVSNNQWPVIFCQSISTAQELTRHLSQNEIPLAVHQQIYKINKIYETYGSDLGLYSYFSPKRTKNKVVLSPLSSYRKGSFLSCSERPVFAVQHNNNPLPDHLEQSRVDERFQFYTSSYGLDFQDIIEKVAPKEIIFFGNYSNQYSEVFTRFSGIPAKALFPNDQPPLF